MINMNTVKISNLPTFPAATMESQMISGKMIFCSSFFLKFICLILLHATAESEVSFFIGFKWPKEDSL